MDSGDAIATISARIRTLEPENASKIIGYFLLQDITNSDLIRLAFSTDKVLKKFCEEAKSVLGILNPNARPFNPLHQSLSQSSPRNEFLDFSRNPNPLSPSLTSNTFGYNPDFHHEGSSQQQQQQWSFSANEPGYQFLPGFGSPGGLGSPSERISQNQQQRMTPAHGSPMSNIQGSGQFGVQGGFGSPSEQQRMIAAQFMGDFGSPMSNIQGSGQFGVQGWQGKRYPASHQLYLTFPPESSFTDEDVSTYFGNFGPVVGVRIPNQERRRFGFVSFANAETVTTVLAQRNSHLIGESAVIVKPYQQKETIPQDGQQQQLNQLLERENLLHHPRLSGMDPRDQVESRFGPRMFRNRTQEMLQRSTEQADLQQGIEVQLQRRRQERSLENTRPDSLFGSTRKSGETHHQHSQSIGSPANFPPQQH
ncbi:RNA-binding domain superfamily [Arabidopsis suecica]|uniref:RNA-binding domain superfamily n=1 Tax=Arabidopsis suecica TaxID=45249 RepID=A0A8T2CL90_ARASU|nr:RNA-binding domain superfamily [Arabidopsis suecica]